MTDPHRLADPAPPPGWVVGHPRRQPPTAPGGAEQRSARLAARLEAYSRYAALVADEAAATVRGDAARAEALAGERAALAEHYEELRALPSGGAADPAFGVLLADALVEADHQLAVDDDLRRRLLGLAGFGRALPAGAPEVDVGATDDPVEDAADGPGEGDAVAGVVDAFAGALVDARSLGAGGLLAGYYPGVSASGGEAEAIYGVEVLWHARQTPGGASASDEPPRLDVRF